MLTYTVDRSELLLQKQKQLIDISSKYFEMSISDISYATICEDFKLLSDTPYVVLNLFDDKQHTCTSVAIAGNKNSLPKFIELLGFDPVGKVWPLHQCHENIIFSKSIVRLGAITEFDSELATKVSGALTSAFGAEDFYSIGIYSNNKFLGNLVLLLPKGEQIEFPEVIENFAKQAGGLIGRKANELELEKERRKLKIISEYSPDLLFIVNRNRKIEYINRTQWNKMEDVMQQDVLTFVPNNYKTQFERWLSNTFENKKPMRGEMVAIGLNSPETIYSVQFIPYFNEEEVELVYIISSDITEIKLVENKLERNVGLYEKLMYQIPGRIFQYRVDVNGKGEFMYMSQKEKNLFGIETEKIFEDPDAIWNLVDPVDARMLKAAMNESSSSLRPIDIEFRVTGKQLREGALWRRIEATPELQLDGSVVWYAHVSSIDEQKLTEIKLRKAEEDAKHSSKFIQQIISQIPGTIFELKISNDGEAEFTFISDVIKKGSLLSKQQAPHLREVFDQIHPYDKDHLFYLIDKSLVSIEPINAELRLRDQATGKYGWKLLQATPEKDENDNIVFYGYLGSIDEMKEAQFKLMEAKEEAEKANKAKSEFIANMSHEIRTPLNAVLGFSELLKGNTREPKYEKYIEGILSGGKNLLSLINDILDLSKIEAGHMNIQNVPVDLYSLVTEFKQLFAQKAEEKNIQFNLRVSNGLIGHVLIDETRIRQILFNLLGNAFKFTEKGEITLMIECIDTNVNRSKLDLLFSVKDSGIGIQKDQQKLIFEAFKQQDGQSTRKYGGTGLGLAITKRLVDMMNGELRLESTPGKGSTFSVYIKNIDISAVEENSENSLNNTTFMFQNQTILLVEDIQSNREVVKGFLERHNVDVVTAENGKDALEKLDRITPDLILMDMMMPIMDGYTATKHIRADVTKDSIPIIALTASALKQSEDDIREWCNDYLRKPISKSQLLYSLSNYLKHSIVLSKDAEDANYLIDLALLSDGQKQELCDSFGQEWEETKELMSIDDIIAFSRKIEQYAIANNIESLCVYATKMISHADNFEIDELNKQFMQFKDMIN